MLILQSLLLGIPQGALYGMMGFGIALIFRSAGVMNFSHGTGGMIGTFVGFTLYSWTGSLLLALAAATVAGGVLGALIQRGLMSPVKNLSHGGMLIITLGLLMIFEGLAILVWGTEYRQLPELITGAPLILNLGTGRLVMPRNDFLITLIALAVSISLAVFLKYARWGMAARARAEDRIGALAVGIDTGRIDALVWGIGVALSVVVGVLIAPKVYVHSQMMTNMQIYGFTAAVLGGFGSPFGAIGGGLLFGVLEKLVGAYISPDYQLSIVLAVIIIVLAFKPSGLFSRHFAGRV